MCYISLNNLIRVRKTCPIAIAGEQVVISNRWRARMANGKEWLTAEGYLWTKFQKAMGIFTDSNYEKSQSMEISDIGGYIDDDGILNIESAVFTALCILGDDVRPAMSGSTIEALSERE